MDIFRYLEDHDRPHNGTISKSQFLSALSAAGINIPLNDAALIFMRYALNDDDYDEAIDYLSFNDDLLEMSKSVWRQESKSPSNTNTTTNTTTTTATGTNNANNNTMSHDAVATDDADL